MQTINNMDEDNPCSTCGENIAALGKFTYLGSTENTPRQKDEHCKCNSCGAEFIIHYDFFDKDGHINSFIFSNDVNDPTYNWQDQLTLEQKKEIGIHLSTCDECNNRLNEEMISDALLASLLHGCKK